MQNKKIALRLIKDRLFSTVLIIISSFSVVPLGFILYFLVVKGATAINLEFLLSGPNPYGEPGGGIAHAIVGTLILILLAAVISIPFGLSIGIFLAEFQKSKLAYWVRLGVDILQGIPSIVIGIIAWSWIVRPMRAFTALSGGIALALMMLPIIVRSTEETIKLIPTSIKEASLSLGVSYYHTILKVILPSGISGIVCGILLSVARIAGETAPLIFTAFGSRFMNLNIMKPVESMPLLIYRYASSPYRDLHTMAWGASFVLVVFVLTLNIVAKGVCKRWCIKY
jgi:phosphate transport system permease protein